MGQDDDSLGRGLYVSDGTYQLFAPFPIGLLCVMGLVTVFSVGSRLHGPDMSVRAVNLNDAKSESTHRCFTMTIVRAVVPCALRKKV